MNSTLAADALKWRYGERNYNNSKLVTVVSINDGSPIASSIPHQMCFSKLNEDMILTNEMKQFLR